jgi:hypothetical protein
VHRRPTTPSAQNAVARLSSAPLVFSGADSSHD